MPMRYFVALLLLWPACRTEPLDYDQMARAQARLRDQQIRACRAARDSLTEAVAAARQGRDEAKSYVNASNLYEVGHPICRDNPSK